MRVNQSVSNNVWGVAVKKCGAFPRMENTGNPFGMEEKMTAQGVRKMLWDSKQGENNPFAVCKNGAGILSSTLNYGENLKAKRQQLKDASLEVKKLKYQFKNLSAQIMRSKTSASARQVVGQAKREVLRLKQEKQRGSCDSEELEAAINHAKAMERVARKKVKHLEEEELAKACGVCADYNVEEEIKKSEDRENSDFSENDLNEEGSEEDSLKAVFQDFSPEEWFEDEMQALMDDFSEEMQALLEDMGLEELSESLEVVKGDMDPADLRMMKIKHRNKEMKEIVKADSEYLKAYFEHLEKPEGGSVPTQNVSWGAAVPPVYAENGSAMPSIDLFL